MDRHGQGRDRPAVTGWRAVRRLLRDGVMSALLLGAGMLGAWIAPAWAAAPAVWGTSCAGCHGNPPRLPSESVTYGKIFTHATALDSQAALRDAIASNASMGPGVASAVLVADMGTILTYLRDVRDARVAPGALAAFDATRVGQTQAVMRTTTVTNERGLPLDMTCAITGTHAADFQIVSCPVSVGATSAANVTVRFAPSAAGAREGNLRITLTSGSGPGAASDPTPPVRDIGLSGTGTAPQATVPAQILAAATVGTPASAQVQITNPGNTDLVVQSIVAADFGGPQAAEFRVDTAVNTCGTGVVPMGGSCVLAIWFDPQATGPREATLTLRHDAAGSPASVALRGTATPAPAPAIEVGSAGLAFGNQVLGTPPVAQSFTVRNAGTAVLNWSSIAPAGAAAADYTPGGTCAVGTALAVNATCTVTVAFRPSVLGDRPAQLVLASNASNGHAVLTLSGRGVPVPTPAATLSVASVDFGPRTVGGLYASRPVTLTNSGTAVLAIAGWTVSGAAMGFTSDCAGALVPGASCTVQADFVPTQAGVTYAGELVLTSNAATSPDRVALVGQGVASAVPSLAWSPAVAATLDLGTVSAAGGSASGLLTLRNAGPGGATIALVHAVGVDAGAFPVGGSCLSAGTLLEGQTCQVEVRFVPARGGGHAARLQVIGSGSAPPELALAGIGLAGPQPTAALSPASLDFGDTARGAQSLPLDLALASTGTSMAQITSVAVPAGFVRVAGGCPEAPFLLSPGDTCAIRLAHAPATEGEATGTVTVQVVGLVAPLQASVRGRGTAAPPDSGGGCSIASPGRGGIDPVLALLVAGAVGVLVRRRRRGRASS